MADLPSSIIKMNDIEVSGDSPITEALIKKIGSNINGLIDRKVTIDEFTSSGTWVVPNVNPGWVWLLGCGGGGGGGGGGNNSFGNGGGGGAGSRPYLIAVDISAEAALANITVTVGAGGGGAGGFGVGGTGGNTTFVGLSTYATFLGAPGGTNSQMTGSSLINTQYSTVNVNALQASHYGGIASITDPRAGNGITGENFGGGGWGYNQPHIIQGGGTGFLTTTVGANAFLSGGSGVQAGKPGLSSEYASGGAGGALVGGASGGGGGGAGLGPGGNGGPGNGAGSVGGIGAGGGGNGGDGGGSFAGAGGPGYLAVIYFDVST